MNANGPGDAGDPVERSRVELSILTCAILALTTTFPVGAPERTIPDPVVLLTEITA